MSESDLTYHTSGPNPPGGPRRMGLIGSIVFAACALIVVVLLAFWYVVRVEVDADEVLILVNKTGRNIPADLSADFADQVVLYPALVEELSKRSGMAPEDVRHAYKGIQYEVLKEGRYFPNPYSYERVKVPIVQTRDKEIGVLIRKYGKALPAGKSVATEPDERGPVAKKLPQNTRFYINTLAYDVQKFPAVEIPEGHVGVVTLLSGREPEKKNTYTVAPGERGVQRETLRPGIKYVNPYLKRIDIVDMRNRTYHMLGSDAIHFPSNDSFTITIEGTIEWSIDPARVAEVTVAYGDEEDIINKIILPYARSISRIEGSKLQAREFISGKTRTAFQDRLLEQLRTACGERGIIIHSALVREILPPADIASLISQREQADQDIDRSRNQIDEAEAEARLVEQQEMQTRNAAIGDARRDTVSLVKGAEQKKDVAITQANRQLEVAKLDLEAATKQASALLARGRAEANVILFDYQARAEPLKNAVAAFGDGMTYAQHFYLLKVAPSIQSILSNTEGAFGDIFRSFQQLTVEPGDSLAKGGDR